MYDSEDRSYERVRKDLDVRSRSFTSAGPGSRLSEAGLDIVLHLCDRCISNKL